MLRALVSVEGRWKDYVKQSKENISKILRENVVQEPKMVYYFALVYFCLLV